MKTLHYIVGEHALSISFADEANDERLIPSFSRFRVDALSQAPLFCVLVDDAFRWGKLGREIGQFDSAGNDGRGWLSVYHQRPGRRALQSRADEHRLRRNHRGAEGRDVATAQFRTEQCNHACLRFRWGGQRHAADARIRHSLRWQRLPDDGTERHGKEYAHQTLVRQW